VTAEQMRSVQATTLMTPFAYIRDDPGQPVVAAVYSGPTSAATIYSRDPAQAPEPPMTPFGSPPKGISSEPLAALGPSLPASTCGAGIAGLAGWRRAIPGWRNSGSTCGGESFRAAGAIAGWVAG